MVTLTIFLNRLQPTPFFTSMSMEVLASCFTKSEFICNELNVSFCSFRRSVCIKMIVLRNWCLDFTLTSMDVFAYEFFEIFHSPFQTSIYLLLILQTI